MSKSNMLVIIHTLETASHFLPQAVNPLYPGLRIKSVTGKLSIRFQTSTNQKLVYSLVPQGYASPLHVHTFSESYPTPLVAQSSTLTSPERRMYGTAADQDDSPI